MRQSYLTTSHYFNIPLILYFTLLISVCVLSANTEAADLAHKEVPTLNVDNVLLTSVELNEAGDSSELMGSWELIAGRYLNEQEQWVDYKDLNLVAIKVISKSHFSFTTMQIKDGVKSFWAAASGTYIIESKQYIEYPHLNSFNVGSEESFRFNFEIIEEHWHSKRFDLGKLKEVEVWKRIE
ncbi:hypothetical protein [Shewanella donghaensis]|uniref:hypothetical protein n=1 Tax=Shewanella donghaensis TaxID=238836 RepID=UPI001182F2F9|nr:hypothetical protein [Shewanella donghaensis]